MATVRRRRNATSFSKCLLALFLREKYEECFVSSSNSSWVQSVFFSSIDFFSYNFFPLVQPLFCAGGISLKELVDGASVLGLNENTARDWYFSLPKNENFEVDMELIIEKFLERPAGLDKSAYGLDHRGYTQVYIVIIMLTCVREGKLQGVYSILKLASSSTFLMLLKINNNFVKSHELHLFYVIFSPHHTSSPTKQPTLLFHLNPIKTKSNPMY
jgi:hypothetical protein